MQHLLLATDGSSDADRAADVAAKLAKATGARLSILTVGGNLSKDEMQRLSRAERDIDAALEAGSDQVLAYGRQRAQRAGVSDLQVHAEWGDAAEVIIETARRQQVGPARPSAPGRIAPWQRVTKGGEPGPMCCVSGSMNRGQLPS